MKSMATNMINLLFWLYRSLARGARSTIQQATPGLFVYELIRRPGTVGAVCSSSATLTRAMAKSVPADGEGLVVELGAGTGTVTSALLEQGISPARLVLIEQSPAFVRHLRRRYPSLLVVQGDAAKLNDYLPKGAAVDAIVSSLPLRSLPPADVNSITAQWRRLLPHAGILVQFTYDLRGLTPSAYLGFEELERELIWRNIPPARVVTLSRDVEGDECSAMKSVA